MSKVLLVEDEDWIYEEVRRILEAEGFTVLWTDAYTEALKIADQETIELAVIDAKYILLEPYVDGYQLLGFKLIRSLRTRRPDLPIVAMSIWLTDDVNDPPIPDQALAAGADEFVDSPPTREALIEAIRRAVAKHTRGANGCRAAE